MILLISGGKVRNGMNRCQAFYQVATVRDMLGAAGLLELNQCHLRHCRYSCDTRR